MRVLSPQAAKILQRMIDDDPQRIEHEVLVDELSSFITQAAGRRRYKVVRRRVCEAGNAIDESAARHRL